MLLGERLGVDRVGRGQGELKVRGLLEHNRKAGIAENQTTTWT